MNPRVGPYLGASAVVCAAAVISTLAVPAGPVRASVTLGILTAVTGAGCAMVALALLIDRGINGVLAGFTIGFFLRALLLGGGLVAALAHAGAALPFVAAFFAVYAPTQVIEVLFVVRTKGAKA